MIDQDLIGRLAREAGFGVEGGDIGGLSRDGAPITTELRRFAALVAEQCAKECERTKNRAARFFYWHECAAAIRAKFKEPG